MSFESKTVVAKTYFNISGSLAIFNYDYGYRYLLFTV
jgi:hypothetical protein